VVEAPDDVAVGDQPAVRKAADELVECADSVVDG